MDADAKRRGAEAARRSLTEALLGQGFVRTKPTFWVREGVFVSEFVHAHLFTFGPAFRIHFGIRAMNDAFEAAALNGPDSDDFRARRWFFGRARRERDFRFGQDLESQQACGHRMGVFILETGEPWFTSHRDLERLARSKASPLSPEARAWLSAHLAGKRDPGQIALSRSVLGLPDPPFRQA